MDTDDEAPVLRPFADVLRDMGSGQVADDCAVQLAEVVRAVRATAKPGKFTLQIDVKPMKGGHDALIVNARIATKAPEGDPIATVYYATQQGDLVRDHPQQQPLFPRVVAQPDAHLSDAR